MENNRGLAVTTNSSAVIDSINHFQEQILASGQSGQLILEQVQNHPDNLLLQTYSAVFYLYAQQLELRQLAEPHLLAAEKLLGKGNLREKMTFEAVKAWYRFDYNAAITIFTGLTALYPRDIMAAKLAEWIFYCAGQAYRAKDYLALCDQIALVNQDNPHFIAMHSFAYELCDLLPQAKKLAEQAIAMEKMTPWAHHTLAHAHLRSNQIEEGIRCLRTLQPTWDAIHSLMRGHNHWHLALFYLALRDEHTILDLFSAISGTLPELPVEQVDAIALLWRMDMAGLPQNELLNKIAAKLGDNPLQLVTGFNTTHFVYCLARTSTAEPVLKAIYNGAEQMTPGYQRDLWLSVILPACQAIVSYVNHDFQTACDLLEPIITRCPEMGGSDAQTELYTQTCLACLLALKKKDQAWNFFQKHLSHYRDTPLADFWFS
ncbi:tetratricopeptide repeat protein [Legionella dresdenensis]|uniref:Tetratricopeptide repeat protein 38 n=1 Tax=Legionella dresdenensis TaxID=450200 RepID=A0ABV8CFS9_9GAMM